MISIITPIYNITYDKWNLTYNSIKDQLNENFEWVIILDGSNVDELIDIIPYEEIKRDHIHAVTIWENYGPSVARNVGFQISRGDYIGYLDMGDYLSPNYKKDATELIVNYPNVDIFFLSYLIQQEGYPDFKIIPAKLEMEYGRYSDIAERQNVSIPLGVLHTRWSFATEGGFQPGIVCGEDGVLWRRMLKFCEYMTTDTYAGMYKVDQHGQSRTQRRFDRGAFAFNGADELGSNGQYLDDDWYSEFHSNRWYEK